DRAGANIRTVVRHFWLVDILPTGAKYAPEEKCPACGVGAGGLAGGPGAASARVGGDSAAVVRVPLSAGAARGECDRHGLAGGAETGRGQARCGPRTPRRPDYVGRRRGLLPHTFRISTAFSCESRSQIIPCRIGAGVVVPLRDELRTTR